MYTYQNIHRHSHRTNIRIADSVASNEAYAKRAKELGHGVISSCEHGWQGRYIECFELAQQYGLKFVEAAEAYWVKDRTLPDRTNCHIVLAAKNENGRRALNKALSEANISGFYGQARLDIPLLLSLPPKDIIVQTACVAYWKYEDVDDITLRLHDHFKENFYLEVQPHVQDIQRKVNSHVLELHSKYKIPLILGVDSHYIYPNEALERSDYIVSKGISYSDESGFILDYPDGDEVYRRFSEQCVLGHSEIMEAMNNTNIYLDVEEYGCPCFNHEIKMPSLYPEKTQEERDAIYDNLIWSAWEKEKQNIPPEKHELYEREIKSEMDIVHVTKHADYFILDHEVVKEGINQGGVITSTGRGSGPSFYTNKLLGLTEIDRISAPVKMYPERFMSPTRILEAGTLADLDLNVADRAPFLRAQKTVFGEDQSWPMIAYGTLKTKAAWKMYAKSQNIDFELANQVSEQIDRYEMAQKHNDDDQELDPFDYIDKEYQQEFSRCGAYLGITSHVTPHPCATLVYNGNISEEIGLINVKGEICTVMDGKWAEEYKFLKNDWLKVSVVDLIDRVFKRICQKRIPVTELLKICDEKSPVWDIYKKGCTLGINQVEQPGTSQRVGKYAPQSDSELCAFVAAIRPGFASMYKTFERRTPFSYGIPTLDAILQTPQMPNSFILYQELAMAVINYAGIPMSECYEIIKNIAKKRVEKVLAYKEKFLDGFTKSLIANGESESSAGGVAQEVWRILEDSSRYSFNCVSGDTVIQRPGRTNVFKPSIGEMYKIATDLEYAKKTHHLDLRAKYRRYGYGKALSMFHDGRIKRNTIIGIYHSGKQQTYTVTTSSGACVTCTMHHKFPTPAGETTLQDLAIGSQVYVKGSYEKNRQRYPFTDGNYQNNLPTHGQRGFQSNDNGASVKYHIKRTESIAQKLPCEVCGVAYTNTARFEVHHKDFDRTNNDFENLQWCCVSCHKKAHYAGGRRKQYEKGIPVNVDVITSIEPRAIEDTYDIEMADPAHNFISESGLVVSNCSHSYSVAIDSMYGAYLKTFYPVEFYETFLRLLDKTGDKDRMKKVQEEAEDYFGIRFPAPRFGQDNRDITGDAEEKIITSSISSIKGYGKDIGDILYECAQQEHISFMSVLLWLDARSIKAAKVKPLILIDYFRQFGNCAELLAILNMFDFLKQGKAKTVKAAQVDGSPMYDTISPYMSNEGKDGKKLLSYKIMDMPGLLDACEQFLRNQQIQEIDMRVKMQNQLEILGYIDLTTNDPDDRRKVIVTDVSPIVDKTTGKPWVYRVNAKSIGTGKTARLSVKPHLYETSPFAKGDIIYAASCSKTQKGYWYLQKYNRVT